MGKKYTITENPPPFTQGLSSTSKINTELYKGKKVAYTSSGRLIDVPNYNIIQTTPIKSESTKINSTIINQDITIINQGNTKTSAHYYHLGSINNINNRTQIINNGDGLGTYDDNTTPIWTTLTNHIITNSLKEFININIILKCATNTLGGAFEIEANNGTILNIVEQNINIQNQDINIEFNIISDQNSVTNGIRFFITPELGMSINVISSSLFIIKG